MSLTLLQGEEERLRTERQAQKRVMEDPILELLEKMRERRERLYDDSWIESVTNLHAEYEKRVENDEEEKIPAGEEKEEERAPSVIDAPNDVLNLHVNEGESVSDEEEGEVVEEKDAQWAMGGQRLAERKEENECEEGEIKEEKRGWKRKEIEESRSDLNNNRGASRKKIKRIENALTQKSSSPVTAPVPAASLPHNLPPIDLRDIQITKAKTKDFMETLSTIQEEERCDSNVQEWVRPFVYENLLQQSRGQRPMSLTEFQKFKICCTLCFHIGHLRNMCSLRCCNKERCGRCFHEHDQNETCSCRHTRRFIDHFFAKF